jgi:ribosomal protein S18 acetylase RimI-like enzyme
MSSVLNYQIEHEVELLALLGDEPGWNSFLSEYAIETFKEALLESETYLCECEGKICRYIRAFVDGFGIYVSELYVAPQCRGNSFGAVLLEKVKEANPNQNVYVLSDEDMYYEKLGCRRIGSVYHF